MKNKNYLLVLILVGIFFIYFSIKMNFYDSKYKDKKTLSGEFTILSIEEKGKYYNKYICKNESGDKFILQVSKSKDISLKEKNKIYLEGTFELPTLNRNEGGFNYRRYLNSQNIYGTITTSNSISLIEEGRIDFNGF